MDFEGAWEMANLAVTDERRRIMKTAIAILASLLLLTGCASDMRRLVASLDTAECAAWEIRQGDVQTVVTCQGGEDMAAYRPVRSLLTTSHN
ncbi:MAG: hypothetical protein L0H63_08080 [Nitrococcus sp.]|nr:hypothetical protein [Nitrococcus sp.]